MKFLDLFRKEVSKREHPPNSSVSPPPRKPIPSKGDYIKNVKEGYDKNVVVAGCVGVYASTLNEPPLVVQRGDGYDYSHPLSLLFNKPNPYQSQAEFWKVVWTYIALGGGAYLLKVKNEYGLPVAVYPYSYAHMTETFSDDGWVTGYVHVDGQKEVSYPVDRVVHLTHPLYTDPMKPYKGLSPINIAWAKIQMYNELDNTTYSLLANNGVPSGIFTAPDNVPAEAVEALKQQSRKVFRRNGRQETDPLVLGYGMTYTQMGLDATKLGSSELLKELEVAICSAFRIHPSVLQTSAGLSASTYANLETAYKEFTTLTRQPFWNAIEEQVRSGFEVDYSDVDLQFDTSHVAALSADPDGNIYPTIAQFNANIVTQNEARASMGYEQIEDGDKFSYERVAASTGFFSAPPPQAKDNEPNPVEGVKEVDGELRVVWEEKQAHLYWKSLNDIQDRASQEMQTHVSTMMDSMRKAVMGGKRSTFNADVDLESLLQAFMKSTGAMRKALLNEILKIATSSINADLSEVQSFIDKISDDAEKVVTAKIKESLGTAQKDISKVLKDNAGQSTAKIKEALLAKFDTLTGSRASAIATTTTKAQTSTTLVTTWTELDKRETNPKRKLNSVWLTRRDSKVRDSHKAMDGKVVKMGEPFTFPDGSERVAPSLGEEAGEDIGCRCTIRPVRASQLGR